MTEYPGYTPPSQGSYPLLTPSDKMSAPLNEPMYQTPIQQETQHLLALDPESEAEQPPVSRARAFGRLLKRKLLTVGSHSEGNDIEPAVDRPPPMNPERPVALTGLAKLVSEKADATTLRLASFSTEKMYEDGIGIDSFYDAGYNLREIHELIPEWTQLLNCGFTKAYLGEQWHIDQLVILYGRQDLRKPQMCQQLGFTIDDFMLARTTREQYAELGINGDMLQAMNIDFEHLFAMHMPFEQFVEEFGITKEHVLNFGLTQHQARALAVTRGWNFVALEETLQMDEDEIRAFGVALT